MSHSSFNRYSRAIAIMVTCSAACLAGCFAPWVSDDDPATRREQIKETLKAENRPRIVAQIGYERMLTQSRLENIGLVSRLLGTGGKVNASQPREKMLDHMRRNEVDQPNTLLDDPKTAMVVAHINAPPAARKGEIFDVFVQLSTHAESTSLRRGWLLETPLVEMSKLGGQVRSGFELASAEGQVVTTAEMSGSEDPADQLRGIVVGGARLHKGRDLGIGIEADFADAITMAAVLPAINARFTVFDGRKQTGIAIPKEDSYIQLDVPPRYQLDPFHFVNVVLQISFNESMEQRQARVETLSRQLREPTTVRSACWQLEAIGQESVPVLAAALDDPDREIRFYAAHTLAYLNDRRSIIPLAELCRQEPAFRTMCLNGLTIIDHYEAADALEELLHAADAETRYGAVRALRRKDERNPQVSGQQIGEVGKILEVPSAGPPLIAVSLSQLPEIVIFGENPTVNLPEFEYVTPEMIIRRDGPASVTISHFLPGEEDQVVQTATDLRSLLEGIAAVGGTYGNWVSFVRQISSKGHLIEPIAMNPIPSAGRVFQRNAVSKFEPGEHMMQETMILSSTEESPPKPKKKSDNETANSSWYNPFSWWQK
jgi:hypothetical protein